MQGFLFLGAVFLHGGHPLLKLAALRTKVNFEVLDTLLKRFGTLHVVIRRGAQIRLRFLPFTGQLGNKRLALFADGR